MNNIESHLSAIQVKEQQLETLSEMIDKEGLTQCIRLLSTYIAMYKKDFGELSLESYEAILESTSVDPDLVNVFENGMNEALAMLAMIVNMQKLQDDGRLTITIN
jgi:hypothetical protein